MRRRAAGAARLAERPAPGRQARRSADPRRRRGRIPARPSAQPRRLFGALSLSRTLRSLHRRARARAGGFAGPRVSLPRPCRGAIAQTASGTARRELLVRRRRLVAFDARRGWGQGQLSRDRTFESSNPGVAARPRHGGERGVLGQTEPGALALPFGLDDFEWGPARLEALQ